MNTSPNIINTLRALMSDASMLVRQEINLARAEAEEKLEQAQTGLIAIGASLVIALAALLVLVQALVVALGNLMPPSLAALLVGVALAVIAFVTMKTGQGNLKPKNLTPRRTINSVKKSAESIKESV